MIDPRTPSLKIKGHLRWSSVTHDDLLLYYTSVIRPVIEYRNACPVCQSGLTVEQREVHSAAGAAYYMIISGSSDYELNCVLHDIEPIKVRLDNLARSFFQRILNRDDCLNYLLPSERHQLKSLIDCANRTNSLVLRDELNVILNRFYLMLWIITNNFINFFIQPLGCNIE